VCEGQWWCWRVAGQTGWGRDLDGVGTCNRARGGFGAGSVWTELRYRALVACAAVLSRCWAGGIFSRRAPAKKAMRYRVSPASSPASQRSTKEATTCFSTCLLQLCLQMSVNAGLDHMTAFTSLHSLSASLAVLIHRREQQC
jgi:hypothetical protein